MLVSVLVFAHFSWMLWTSFSFCPRLHLRQQITTFVPNPVEGLIVKSFPHYRHTAAMVLTAGSEWKTLKIEAYAAWRDETLPEGNTWEYVGHSCPLVTDRLNPLLRPHVTKCTCYGNIACSSYCKYQRGPALPNGITEPSSPAERQ